MSGSERFPLPTRHPISQLRLSQAIALGTLHGPAELLPISSSGHVALAPWLLRWDYGELDGDLRKAFEVALHAGTAAALLIALRDEVREALAGLNVRVAVLKGLSSAPAAIVGYAFERPIERHLGTPPTIAAGLLAGAVAMVVADRAPQLRKSADATSGDALCLGIAQACALVPGVSRNGATLAAARLRGFTRADANRLSRHAALPVMGGATILKAIRLRRRGLPAGAGLPFASGALASFISTLASARLIHQVERDSSLAPYAIYRILLAGWVIRRLVTATPPGPQVLSSPRS